LRNRKIVCLVMAIVPLAAAGPVAAQSNLDAGKSPAQIFSDTCNACHRSPREIKRTSPAFLREHYTTGLREATAMAAYLASVGSDPTAVQQRRPPAMGAGKPSSSDAAARPPPADQATPPAAAEATTAEQARTATRARRPSESVEFGATEATDSPAAPKAATVPAARRFSAEQIEE